MFCVTERFLADPNSEQINLTNSWCLVYKLVHCKLSPMTYEHQNDQMSLYQCAYKHSHPHRHAYKHRHHDQVLGDIVYFDVTANDTCRTVQNCLVLNMLTQHCMLCQCSCCRCGWNMKPICNQRPSSIFFILLTSLYCTIT